MILLSILAMIGNLDILSGLTVILILAGIVAVIILRVKAFNTEKRYRNYSSDVLQKIAVINNRFLQVVNLLAEDVDKMYLDSLDPVHRELVLMRREHNEAQKKNEELQNNLINLQIQMANEQKQMRRSQQNEANAIMHFLEWQMREADETITGMYEKTITTERKLLDNSNKLTEHMHRKRGY